MRHFIKKKVYNFLLSILRPGTSSVRCASRHKFSTVKRSDGEEQAPDVEPLIIFLHPIPFCIIILYIRHLNICY